MIENPNKYSSEELFKEVIQLTSNSAPVGWKHEGVERIQVIETPDGRNLSLPVLGNATLKSFEKGYLEVLKENINTTEYWRNRYEKIGREW